MNYQLTDTKEIQQALDWLARYGEKPPMPEYFAARSLDEAVGLLKEYGTGAELIAGGIDILSLLKNRVLSPNTLINLKSIPGLRYLGESVEGLSCGPLTLIRDLQYSDLLQRKYPILAETASLIASPHLRNQITLGGNLLQEVRCWYYRRSPETGIAFQCRRKTENGRCEAADGENQYHAIFNAQGCRAVNPSDLATTLCALDAQVKTVSVSAGRSLPLDQLYTPLGNTLESGEVISRIQVPVLLPNTRQRFLKFRVRKAIDFAIVSVAAVIQLTGDRVQEARVVLGGVAHKPWRVIAAEEILKGEKVTESLAVEAARAALADAKPLAKNGYKLKVAETLLKRAILE